MTRTEVLSDEMWARIEPVLPALKGSMGRPMRQDRPLVEGAIYRYRTGIAWRDLPAQFGPWQTVWKRHHRFSTDGTWDKGRCSANQGENAAVMNWSGPVGINLGLWNDLSPFDTWSAAIVEAADVPVGSLLDNMVA